MTDTSLTADKPKQSDKADGKPGVGKPDEFVSAFVTAIREPPPHDPIAASVAPAFSLGWYLRALTRPEDATVGFAVGSGLTDLTVAQGIAFCRHQVKAGVKRLEKVVSEAGQDALGVPDEAAAKRVSSAAELDVDAFAILSAVDARLGRAYLLAGEMLDLSAPASGGTGTTLKAHVANDRVAPLVAGLDDLATAFPPHAGHAVRDSLVEWTNTFAGPDDPPEFVKVEGQPDPDPWARLRRQGQLWRAVLAGEKACQDMLEIPDYLEAAKEASGRVRAIARRCVRDFPVLVALVLLLFFGGIALIVILNDGAGAAAGAGAILASLGLSWKGVGGVLGRLARQLEEPLWGAEMDRAITRTITLIRRQDEGARDASKARRHLADALPTRPSAR